MAKFNKANTMKTTNKCGYPAYSLADKEKLVSMVLTSFFNEKKFYGDNSNELVELAEKSDMEFVSHLAVCARQVFNLRSVSHVLTAIVARYGKGQLTRYAINGVVLRPDDITEIMSVYKQMYGKPFPNAMKREIANKMNKFNEFQFAKYNGGNKDIKFKDVLRICHPAPVNATQDEVFKAILEDNLTVPYTWETELSKRGNTQEVWEELIDSGKVGYMALLRNFRNIIKASPANINKVYATLADPYRVSKSKQLPFRFFSAYKTLQREGLASTKVVNVLEDAISASCGNIPTLNGKTLIAIDVSGSMDCPISAKSDVMCRDIACVMGAIATKICEDAVVVTFDTQLKKYALSTRTGILTNAERLNTDGGGTNMHLPFRMILESKEFFDRVIVLSDNECNNQFTGRYGWYGRVPVQKEVDEYRKTVNPNLWVHAIDLAGYGTSQFIGGKTDILAGWSERVFDFINLTEGGITNLVKAIEQY